MKSNDCTIVLESDVEQRIIEEIEDEDITRLNNAVNAYKEACDIVLNY